MSQIEQDRGADVVGMAPAGRRIAFDRLRERTDELELLISGLLAFGLLTLPSRMFDAWVGSEVHADGIFSHALQFAFTVGVGLCYSLGIALVCHLAIRGYWVGLIGLKSSFPDGIQWDRLKSMGPVTRAFYRARMGDLGDVIDRVDRTASILFAMTILIGLTIAWTGVLGLMFLLPAALIGLLFEDSERATLLLFGAFYVGFIGVATAVAVLDRRVTHAREHGQPAPRMERALHILLRAFTVIVPQRLGAPVQFTLQSNLGGRAFNAVYIAVLVLALIIGGLQIYNSVRFSPINPYRIITTEALEGGMLSAHYESMRGPDDVMLRYPMIPSDRISERRLRLFIPHVPRRDNPMARENCKALDRGRNAAEGAEAAGSAVRCLAMMWTVTLDGKPLSLDGFVPIERRDVGMRGLMGYIDLQDRDAGRHDLHLQWNARGDERGVQRRREFRIPFWYDPERR